MTDSIAILLWLFCGITGWAYMLWSMCASWKRNVGTSRPIELIDIAMIFIALLLGPFIWIINYLYRNRYD